jgi:uncharacterized protein (TIGR00297 family)
VVAYLGYRARALTLDGAIVACLVGGAILGFGGLSWAILLVFFFASSSALSFVKANDARKRRAAETFEKGGRRDAAQVLANGGIGALLALLYPFAGPNSAPIFGAYLGALAAATADTWATEIGVLSERQPRMITTGRAVAAGASGGVTWLGSAAGAAGALCLGLLAAGVTALPGLGANGYARPMAAVGAALLGGLAGSLADSLLGATVQASYRCPACDKVTESRVHRCGTATEIVKGLPWVNNDLVNLVATAVGALAGGIVGWAL